MKYDNLTEEDSLKLDSIMVELELMPKSRRDNINNIMEIIYSKGGLKLSDTATSLGTTIDEVSICINYIVDRGMANMKDEP